MRISVVMPCYNSAAYIKEAVTSVFAQDYENVELIVVDDGSNDGTVDILKDLGILYSGRMNLLLSKHIGQYPARNLALKHIRGDLIAFLDADDWWENNALSELCRTLVEHRADLVYCGWQNVGSFNTSVPHIPTAYEEEDLVRHFLSNTPWPIHGVLFRREIAERLRGFSEYQEASMDYDFWLRMLALFPKIKRVPKVLAFYRWHGNGQVSSVKSRQVIAARLAQEKFVREHPELVSHLSLETLWDLTDGRLIKSAYQALWARDLKSAHQLFRYIGIKGIFSVRDIFYVFCALWPFFIYDRLIKNFDSISVLRRRRVD